MSACQRGGAHGECRLLFLSSEKLLGRGVCSTNIQRCFFDADTPTRRDTDTLPPAASTEDTDPPNDLRANFWPITCRSPIPSKPLVTEWHLAKPGAPRPASVRLLTRATGSRHRILLDADSSPWHKAVIPGLDCVAVDATIGYYLDGSIADRLQREIIEPARALATIRRSGSSAFPWAGSGRFSMNGVSRRSQWLDPARTFCR